MAVETISIFGCGWLGFPLAREVSSKGFKVKGSTSSEDKLEQLSSAGVEPFFIKCDPELSGESDEKIAQFFQCDVLLITLPFRRSFKDPWDYYLQMRSIVEAAAECHVKRIVFTSSTSVYPSLNHVCTEEDILEPTEERAKALYATEQSVLLLDGVKSVVLRLGGLYGPDRVIGKFLSGKTDIANPEGAVNLVHLDDVLRVTALSLISDVDGVFNVVCDEHPTRRELYTEAAQKLGLPEPKFDESQSSHSKVVSNTKLKQTFDYKFLHPKPLT